MSAFCDQCSSADAQRYCKQCTKFLCQQCLHCHDEWITDHQVLSLDEVVDAAAYLLPQAKPEVPSNCAGHSKPLEIFCETCEELICQLCTVKKHKDHEHDVVSDAYAKHKVKIESAALQPLNQQIARLTEAVANLLKRREEIAVQGERVNGEIHHEITRIKELLDQAEKELNKDVNRALKYKLEVTNHQTQEAKAVLGQLIDCRNHVQQSLKVGTPYRILTTKSQLTTHSENVVAKAEDKTFEPLEQADMEFVIKGGLDDIVGNIGKILYNTINLSVSSSYQHIPLVGQQSTITVSLSLPDGMPAPVPSSLVRFGLSPPNSNKSGSIQCTIKDFPQAGQYSVIFTPNTRGVHQLHATTTIHDRIIPGSPMSIPVSVPPRMRGTPVETIGTGLNAPVGIAVTNGGQVIVCECSGHCITVLDKDGGRVKSFGTHGHRKGQLECPQDFAITSKGTLLVVDGRNDRVQEFTMDGEYVSCVGSLGDGPLQFNYPTAIAINRTTGQVCIADCDNHRVQVLNADLTFSHMFGSRGSGQGQFDKPCGVGIDIQGFVYVADMLNNRIQQFTAEGKWLSSFGTKGSEPGRLTFPRDITVDDDDLLYVCEGHPNYRISVFTTTDFVCCFGKSSSLGSPMRSAFDKYGGLCVCDIKKNNIIIL